MIKTFWDKYWIYLVPLIICSLIMLPRFLEPHFGLMDDGEAIQKANLIIDDQWGFDSELASGRFRPLYWYIHYMLFLVFGTQPLGYFLVNYLVLVLLIVGVIKLLKIFGSSNPTILITCILFLFSGPIPESYFTLSKYEIFQLVFIVYAILISEQYTRAGSSIGKILIKYGSISFSLASYLIKETSLIMPVIYAGWLTLEILEGKTVCTLAYCFVGGQFGGGFGLPGLEAYLFRSIDLNRFVCCDAYQPWPVLLSQLGTLASPGLFI